MAGWSSILGTLGSMIGGSTGGLITAGTSAYDYYKASQQNQKVEDGYYGALANSQKMNEIAAQIAANRAQTEAALRQSILNQTGQMSSDLFAAQNNMGAMPQFDQGRIDQEYSDRKATLTNDFMNMINLVESQGRAGQITRLGGAGSVQADQDRATAIATKYAPMLAQIDQQAMDGALSTATNTQNLS